MIKVLITGTEGFIGSHLYKELKLRFDNILTLNEDIFSYHNWKLHIETLFLNAYNPDMIFHVGACSNTLETDVQYMMTRNYESTKILSDWCKANNKKFIYSSSAASYGNSEQYPSNLYGWSKYAGEGIAIRNGGIALRYFNVYGPGEESKLYEMRSVAQQMWIKKLLGKEVKLFPKNPKRDFVYIKDVIDANLFAYENYDKLKGDFYDVGSGESSTFEEVMRLLDIEYGYLNEDSIPKGYQFYTLSKKYMSGWKSKYNLQNGLKEYKHYLLTLKDIYIK